MDQLKWLTICDRYSRMYLDRELLKYQLNSGQYFYLLKICEEPGITQDLLISLVYVNPSNVTRAIAYLKKHDFLKRKQNEKDKRTFHLFPTKKAQDVYPKIQLIRKRWEEQFLHVLEKEEQEILEVLLKKVGIQAVACMQEEKVE